MIPTENKNTIHVKQRPLPNYLPRDLEIVTVYEGESKSQYHTSLAVAKFTVKRKNIKFAYFIATLLIHPIYYNIILIRYKRAYTHRFLQYHSYLAISRAMIP